MVHRCRLCSTSARLRSRPAPSTPPGLAGELFVDLSQDASFTLAQLSEQWQVVLALGGTFGAGLTVRLVPPTTLELTPPPAGTVEGRVALEVVGKGATPSERLQLLGLTGATRVEANEVSAGVLATGSWSTGAPRANVDVGIRAAIKGGRIVVSTAGGDGFLTAILPQDGMQLDFDLVVGWSANKGLHIEGGAGLTIEIPVNEHLGPILLNSVNVGASIESSTMSLTAGITARAELGPVKAVVENIGVRLAVDLAARGNLGAADLTVGFKPPNGIGLTIDAAIIKGGGFCPSTRCAANTRVRSS